MSDSITGRFWFIKWQDLYRQEKPFQILTQVADSSQDTRTTNLVFEECDVLVRDARSLVVPATLDSHGFTLRQRLLPPINFQSRQSVEEIYLPEVERLVKQEVDDVHQIYIFDWRLRNTLPQSEPGTVLDFNDRTAYLRPAIHVHVDQSPLGVLNRVRTMLKDQAPVLLRHRVRIINVWRPLVDFVNDWPLAVCDGSTVDPEDLIEVDQIRKQHVGSTYYMQRNTMQKFYYYSKQSREDVLLLKMFDSQQDGIRAPYCPHASFELSNETGGTGVPRESIEVRCLVFSTSEVKVPLGWHQQIQR